MQSILKNNLGQSRIIKIQNIFLKTGFLKKSFEQIFFCAVYLNKHLLNNNKP